MARRYDMRLRELKREKRLLESLERSIQRAAEKMDEEENEEEPRMTRTERRREKRRAELPADMRCPECKQLFTSLRAWVVKQRLAKGEKPCCRRCHLER